MVVALVFRSFPQDRSLDCPRREETEAVDSKIEIIVQDTGTGISRENINKIYDPFFTTKAAGKGTGLGLSICFGIVQEHNGKILCYNRQEGGAVFRVELPAVLAAFPAKELQQLTTQGSNPRKPG